MLKLILMLCVLPYATSVYAGFFDDAADIKKAAEAVIDTAATLTTQQKKQDKPNKGNEQKQNVPVATTSSNLTDGSNAASVAALGEAGKFGNYQLAYQTDVGPALTGATFNDMLKKFQNNETRKMTLRTIGGGVALDITITGKLDAVIEYSCDDKAVACVATGGNTNGKSMSGQDAGQLTAMLLAME